MDDSVMKNCDRLSELPDSLIFEIFWFMPMRDVVRTTILSSRWKNLWITAPYLNFEDFKIEIDTVGVRNLVERVLVLWSGMGIEKFKIDFGTHHDKYLYSDIDLLLDLAMIYRVEELYVDLKYVAAMKRRRENLYWAPQCLYSCSSLQKLYLRGCNLHIPINNVNWNQLKMLTIDCYGLNETAINQILCGIPKLEVFFLYLLENRKNLCIQSSSLRHLFIDKYLYFERDDPSTDTELRIWAPNLEMLEISGVPYRECLINNVPSMTHAALSFDGPTYYRHYCFSGNKFIIQTLRQILPTIQHVEELVLSDWCIKVLGAKKNKDMLSPFPNVKSLKLKCCLEDYEEIVRVLEIFPKLEKLVLQHEKGNKQFRHGRESLEFEPNLPNSFLQQLRIIMVICAEGEDSIFPFIEILLKHASKLEKTVYQLKETKLPSNSLVLARSSPTSEFILL